MHFDNKRFSEYVTTWKYNDMYTKKDGLNRRRRKSVSLKNK